MAISGSYLPPGVGGPGAPSAFVGERLGPAGWANALLGSYWPQDLQALPAAGSGASKKLRRRPEPVPRTAQRTHTVAASCLPRRVGRSLKVGPFRPLPLGPDPFLLLVCNPVWGCGLFLWLISPVPASSPGGPEPCSISPYPP